MSFFVKTIRRIDWVTVAVTGLLVLVGLAAIYSVDLSRGSAEFTNFKKQLIAGGLGFFVLIVLGLMNYKFLESYARVLYVFTLILLGAVLLFGETIRGTTGWFSIGSFNFQPVEFAKFSTLLSLVYYFDRHTSLRFSLKSVMQSFIIAGLPAGLILAQPDFGGASMILGVWFFLLLIFGIKKSHFISLFLISCFLFFVSWFFVLAPYQKERIVTFVNPFRDPSGAGYNVRQSIIAIGAGRFLGRGLGFGSQSQLKFLPESQTDFIFAVIAEELGFVMSMVVVALYLFLLYRFLRIARLGNDDFTILLVLGVTLLFALEFLVNVGMNLGIMPVMGIALPFLSYGGSSLIMHLAAVGVMISVARRN